MKSLVKRDNASEVLLIIMMAAISSVLVTRMFLEVTKNFQLARGEWHLAHVLWGGVAMFIGGMMPLLFHGEKVRKTGAVFFGVGTGLFIDEIGKFITRDNNYFFQPAALIVYIFFVMLFLLYRYLEKFNPKDPKTLLYQTLDELGEVVENDLEKKEKEEMVKRLLRVEEKGQGGYKTLSQKLLVLVRDLPPKTDRINWIEKLYKKLRWWSYYKIFKRKIVWGGLLALAIGDIAVSLANTFQLLSWRHSGYPLASLMEREIAFPRFDSYMVVGKVMTDGVAAILFLGGLLWVFNKKIRRGLFYFQTGLLVNIFIVSLFSFYFEQFSAVAGLSINIVILLGINRLKRDILV